MLVWMRIQRIGTSSPISTAREVLNPQLAFRNQPYLFACGEMLDWDAPTGGYLLTACFATGRAAGHGVHEFLSSITASH